jgi:hypothetical protein
MTLNYLDFDYSEDAEGTGTFDAMASVSSAQLPALQAEIAQVLAWAYMHFPDGCGPEEDGGLWQYDLQGVQEVSKHLQLDFDAASSSIQCGLGNASAPRTTLTFSVSGNAEFCEALRAAFGVE